MMATPRLFGTTSIGGWLPCGKRRMTFFASVVVTGACSCSHANNPSNNKLGRAHLSEKSLLKY